MSTRAPVEVIDQAPPAIKAELKIEAIVPVIPPGRYAAGGGLTAELVRTARSTDPGGLPLLEVWLRAWQDGKPIGFGPQGTIETERMLIVNPPILVPDAQGPIVRQWWDETQWRYQTFRDDPRAATLEVLAHNVRQFGRPGGALVQGSVGHTVLTAYPNAGTGTAPMDGNSRRASVNETFSTIRSGAGTHADTNAAATISIVRIDASATSNQYSTLLRSIFGFNTSSIGTGAAINSVTFSLWGTSSSTGLGTPELCVVAVTPGSESTIVASDYNIANWGTTELVTRIATWTTGGYNDMAGNSSFLSYIKPTGNTIVGTRLGWDLDNSAPSWSSSAMSRRVGSAADTTGTTQDPKLAVDYTAAAARRHQLPLMGVS